MGMFNWVNYPPKPCWKCGAEVKGWQSKDHDSCDLTIVPAHEVRHFYAACDQCRAWNAYDVRVKVVEYVVEASPREASDVG